MGEIGAYAIKAVKGAMIADDGQHMLLTVEQPDGNEVVLAFPTEQLFRLVDLAALSLKQADQASGQPPGAFKASWFELGDDPQTGAVMLSLAFGAGGALSFQMERSMAEKILETLKVHLGGESPQTPGIVRH